MSIRKALIATAAAVGTAAITYKVVRRNAY